MIWEEQLLQLMEESIQRREVIKFIRCTHKYKEWRKKIIRRDEYTCQKCGKQRFLGIHAHHKKRLFEVVFKNNITTFKEALDCKEIWDTENGISLCVSCHLNPKT